MNLHTNVVIKGSKSRNVYDSMMASSKKVSVNSKKRAARLAAFSKKLSDSKNDKVSATV